jgi:hypothetical protein
MAGQIENAIGRVVCLSACCVAWADVRPLATTPVRGRPDVETMRGPARKSRCQIAGPPYDSAPGRQANGSPL